MLLAVFASAGLCGWGYVYLNFYFEYFLQAEWEVEKQYCIKDLLEKDTC